MASYNIFSVYVDCLFSHNAAHIYVNQMRFAFIILIPIPSYAEFVLNFTTVMTFSKGLGTLRPDFGLRFW